jgi:hypothetical protein
VLVLELLPHGDDTRLQPRYGNPQALVHDAETDENPRGVWALKKLQLIGWGRSALASVVARRDDRARA